MRSKNKETKNRLLNEYKKKGEKKSKETEKDVKGEESKVNRICTYILIIYKSHIQPT